MIDVFYDAIRSIIAFFVPAEHVSLKHILIFFTALVCSGIFSASEISIFRVYDYQLKSEEGKILRKYRMLGKLVNDKERTLATILIGNNAANVFATLYGTHVIAMLLIDTITIDNDIAFALAGFNLIILLLLFGEIIPKSIAVHNSLRWATLLSPIIYFFFHVFWVLSTITNKISFFINKFFKKSDNTISDGQVLAIVNQGEAEGVFEKNEQDVIKNILNFNETSALAIMTPRHNVFTLSDKEKIHKAKEQVAEQGYSRIPVYKGNDRNNIIAIVNQNDIFKHILKKNGKNVNLSALAQDPTYIYQTTTIQNIFQKLQKEHKQIAVVVDDFGDFKGIITMEDILEEIVGEIRDETDNLQENSFITSTGKNKWVAKNAVDINTFLRVTGSNMTEHENLPYETLQGLIMYKLGRLPKVGDKVVVDTFSFEVEAMKENQISVIQIKKS